MKRWLVVAGLAVTLAASVSAAGRSSGKGRMLYISSFAPAPQGGIVAYRLTDDGKLTEVERTGGVAHPFFLALSPDQRFLYSIDAKEFSGKEDEHVAAFALQGGGKLKLLNRQSSRGTASCYLDVDATGKTLLLANYTTGSVVSYPIQADGALEPVKTFAQHTGKSINTARQDAAHAHCFVISPDNRHALAADLGIDKIMSYRLDAASSTVRPSRQPFIRTAPGAGPRHLTFHPNGKHLYAVNELDETVTLYDYDVKTAVLIERQTLSTLPDDFKGESYCADLKITPDGQYLYATNRGHDSITMYRLGERGEMTRIGIEPSLGKGPQNLLITADGKLLVCANMAGHNISVFRINRATGELTSASAPTALTGPSCIMEVRD